MKIGCFSRALVESECKCVETSIIEPAYNSRNVSLVNCYIINSLPSHWWLV